MFALYSSRTSSNFQSTVDDMGDISGEHTEDSQDQEDNTPESPAPVKTPVSSRLSRRSSQSSQSSNQNVPAKRRRTEDEPLDSALMSYLAERNEERKKNKEEQNDSEVQFMLSQVSTLKKLPPKTRSLAKFKIHELLYKLESQMDVEPEPSLARPYAQANYMPSFECDGYNTTQNITSYATITSPDGTVHTVL
jgi:hypothetical protein